MEVQVLTQTLMFLATAGILGLLLRLYRALVAEPEELRSALRKQGITGSTPTLLLGNIMEIKKARTAATATMAAPPLCNNAPISHRNCSKIIFPLFEEWQKLYGEVFMFSLGNTLLLRVTQHEIVREITTCISLDLGKPSYQAKQHGALLGQGILTSNGTHWAHQRKIIAPELYPQKVKGMINLIQESAMSLVSSWNKIIESGEDGRTADIKIDQHMRSFSGDVISRACFESNYSRAEEIFSKLRALQESASNSAFANIPGLSYLSTKSNREAWAMEKDIKALILKAVRERNESDHEKDLPQMLLEGPKDSQLSQDALERFIVDNCKNIYLAGFETTALSSAWCLVLLASNPEWQERVRAEALDICKGHLPDADMIRQMKVVCIGRNPGGPGVWGSDSYEFNPERLANGIAGACKLPHLYMPFGVGPRVCLGQNLAMVEMKILISLLVTHFRFTLSPTYTHSPALRLVVESEHGVDLLVKKL